MHSNVLVMQNDKSPKFSVEDRIFLGEGLFETLKVVGSQPCFAELHWKRLANSALILGMPFDLSLDAWEECLLRQIKRDKLELGGIKAILSAGIAPRGLTEPGQVSQLAFQTFKYRIDKRPLNLISSSWLRDAANPIYQLKTVNYLEAIIARRHSLALGVDDVLFFNTRHHATETTCANLFLIKNNQIMTPGLNNGVLPGITRSRVLKICEENQISWREAEVTQATLVEAEAVFVTNSLQGIRSIKSLDDWSFALDHPLIGQLCNML